MKVKVPKYYEVGKCRITMYKFSKVSTKFIVVIVRRSVIIKSVMILLL